MDSLRSDDQEYQKNKLYNQFYEFSEDFILKRRKNIRNKKVEKLQFLSSPHVPYKQKMEGIDSHIESDLNFFKPF